MQLRSLSDFEIRGKTVLYRSPYDIETVEKNGELQIVDDSRIRATLPTLEYLIDQDCKIVVLTYVGRPDGRVVEKLRTTPHAQTLSKLLDHPVEKIDECIGDTVVEKIKTLQSGQILMLENTRFHPEEMDDDDSFAQKLSRNGEVVVFDAFPQAHRNHASVTGIMRHLPSVAGFYCEKEVQILSQLLETPQHPFTMIIGGAKISDKVGAIKNLFNQVDIFLVGGAPANVFLAAEGKEMGDAVVAETAVSEEGKEDWLEIAVGLQSQSGDDPNQTYTAPDDWSLHKIQHPYDLVAADDFDSPTQIQTVQAYKQTAVVPQGWTVVDIGPRSQELFAEVIKQSKTVFWNGPMGKIEDERFMNGSKAIAQAMSEVNGTAVVAGGDTVAALNRFIDFSKFTHVSLAGGATLEFLAGEELPALGMLKK